MKTWNVSMRTMHWLFVVLVVGAIASVWGHEAFEKGSAMRTLLMQIHFGLGGLAGLLILPRIAVRLFAAEPEYDMPPAMRRLAHTAHIGLYALLIALPVLGYIGVSGKGLPIELPFGIPITPLPVTEGFAKAAREVHEGLATALLVLLGLHVAAAGFHAIVLKDGVLASMTRGRAKA